MAVRPRPRVLEIRGSRIRFESLRDGGSRRGCSQERLGGGGRTECAEERWEWARLAQQPTM